MVIARTQRARGLVANALGDVPETAIPAHLLRRGLADAYVINPASHFDAAIVQSPSLPHEPWCFGTDPDSVLELLRQLTSGVSGACHRTFPLISLVCCQP